MTRRGFCPNCGSRLFSDPPFAADLMVIVASSLDDPSIFKPAMDIFTSSAQPWDHMDAVLLRSSQKCPQQAASTTEQRHKSRQLRAQIDFPLSHCGDPRLPCAKDKLEFTIGYTTLGRRPVRAAAKREKLYLRLEHSIARRRVRVHLALAPESCFTRGIMSAQFRKPYSCASRRCAALRTMPCRLATRFASFADVLRRVIREGTSRVWVTRT